MKLSDIKLHDVLKKADRKVPYLVTKTFKGHNGETIEAKLEPLANWNGQRYYTKNSYETTLSREYQLNGFERLGNLKETKEKEENKMSKLFKVIGQEVYGFHIGTNSSGDFVLEIRGDENNAIKAFKKDLLEEVKPYTVKLFNVRTNLACHATVEKGKLQKLEFIIWKNEIYTVVELDTKEDNCPEINSKNTRRIVTGEL